MGTSQQQQRQQQQHYRKSPVIPSLSKSPKMSLKSQGAAPAVTLTPPGRWSAQLTNTRDLSSPFAGWAQALGTESGHVTRIPPRLWESKEERQLKQGPELRPVGHFLLEV